MCVLLFFVLIHLPLILPSPLLILFCWCLSSTCHRYSHYPFLSNYFFTLKHFSLDKSRETLEIFKKLTKLRRLRKLMKYSRPKKLKELQESSQGPLPSFNSSKEFLGQRPSVRIVNWAGSRRDACFVSITHLRSTFFSYVVAFESHMLIQITLINS